MKLAMAATGLVFGGSTCAGGWAASNPRPSGLLRILSTNVVAFAKNAGPQALRIDYLTIEGRRAIYTPDFLIRKGDGSSLLAETKGRADRDVPAKARAAVEWCKAAMSKKVKWEYLYVPEKVFEQVRGDAVDELARACAPALAQLLQEAVTPQRSLSLEAPEEARLAGQVRDFVDPEVLTALPSRYRKAVEHAVTLFHFHENKQTVSFAPVFRPLLGPIDHAAEALMLKRLSDRVPPEAAAQRDHFEPNMSKAKKSDFKYLIERASALRKLLVHRSPIMPTGVLQFCLEYAGKAGEPLPGIYDSVRSGFGDLARTGLPKQLKEFYDFRNTYIAHQKVDLTEVARAGHALREWILVLIALHRAVSE